jgi:hypothetical protein
MIKKLTLILNQILSYFPSPLPRGLTQFDKWSAEVIELAGPLADETSMKFALASMVQHLGPAKNKYQTQLGFVPKRHFVNGLYASASKQVAGQVFYDIKQAQLELQKKAQEAAKAEATAVTPGENV